MEDPLISAIGKFLMSEEFNMLLKLHSDEIYGLKQSKAIFDNPHPISTLYAVMNAERFRMEIFTLNNFQFYLLCMKSLQNLDNFITSEILQSECNIILTEFIDLICSLNEVFVALRDINSYYTCYLIEKSKKFVEGYFREIIKDPKIKKKMNRYICKNTPQLLYPTVHCVILQLEETIISPLISSKFSMKSDNIRSIALESILMDHFELFDFAESLYYDTKVRDIPNIGYTICTVLRSLINHIHFPVYIEYFRSLYNTYGINCLYFLRQKIMYFEQFPEIMQFRILEIMRQLGTDNTAELNYLFFTITPALKQQALPEEWAESFIELATSSPFKEVLKTFYSGDSSLESLITRTTYEIVLMKLPKTLHGITLNNLSLILKLLKPSRGSKGATFIIYFHELAHFLLRVNSETFKQVDSPKSTEKGFEEAGYYAERLLFDDKLQAVTYEAAEFIFKEGRTTDPESFKQEFKNLNIEILDNPDRTSIKLHRSFNRIDLGRCGNKYWKKSINKNEIV